MLRRPSTTSDGYAMFARMILDAVGVGGAALLASCGGDVVVDGQVGQSGGSGGAGSSSSASSNASSTSISSSAVQSSSSGPPAFVCNDPNATTYACTGLGFEGCPAANSPEVFDNLSAQFNTSGPCPDNPDLCWCTTTVVSVPCGPDPTVTMDCCYLAQVVVDEICKGRPLLVEGAARVAPLAATPGWSGASGGGADVGDLDPALRARLAVEWASDALFEHASVASFARFALELMSVAAPAELIRDAQRAMGDEIRHAELCFDLASRFGGAPMGPGPLAIEGALAPRTLEEIAVAVVLEGCVGETCAALVAAAARDAATDPAVRAALEEIAGDEASHAALAWRTVAWACDRGGPSVRRAVEAVFAEAAPPACHDETIDADSELVMQQRGRLPASTRRDIARRALTEVVRPCARALLGAMGSPPPRYIGGEAP